MFKKFLYIKVQSCDSANILVVTACASYEQKQKMTTINGNRKYDQVGISVSTLFFFALCTAVYYLFRGLLISGFFILIYLGQGAACF